MKTKVKELLTKNIGLKLLSFLLAVLLWVIIMNINDPYITVTIDGIQVSILHGDVIEDKNKLFEIESGETISIKVRGTRTVIETLKASNFTAAADLNQMSIVNAVPIDVSLKTDTLTKISVKDVEIVSKNPEMMVLTLEDAGEVHKRVEVVLLGEVAEGYYAAEKSVTPNIINIKGSEKQIANINQIVVKVNVAGISESISQNVAPFAYDENGYVVDSTNIVYEINEVQVQVTVLPTKEISLVTTMTGEPAYGYECTYLNNLPQKITIAGTEEALSNIGSYISISFDVTDLTETHSMDYDISGILQEQFPDYSYIVVGEEKNVSVTATIEKLEEKELWVKNSDIIFKNTPDGMKARCKVDGLTKIKIMGLPSILDEITAESMNPYIDLTDVKKGVHIMTLLTDTRAKMELTSSSVVIEVYDAVDDDY